MDSSDEGSGAPSKAEIARITVAIREALRQQLADEEETDPTVNNIRNRAETKLGLGQNFLRTDPFWKNESKKIIKEEFDKQNGAEEEQQEVVEKPKQKKSESKKATAKAKPAAKETVKSASKPASKPTAKAAAKSAAKPAAKAAAKSASNPITVSDDEDKEPKKAAKGRGKAKAAEPVKAVSESELSALSELEDMMSDVEDAPPAKKRSRPKSDAPKGRPPKKAATAVDVKAAKVQNIQIVNAKPVSPPEEDAAIEPAKEPAPIQDQSESEMSEVIDISPQKRKKAKLSDGPLRAKPTSKSKALKQKTSRKSKDTGDADPDAEKIKELQSWLVKCGIRKVWGKELQNCSTPKEKISHLRNMLTEAGMTGRFSIDKAKRIKEERELAEDLAAVQAGARAWGTGDSGAMTTRASRHAEPPSPPPKTRRLVRPELAFLDDQSSESD